jgi:gliding motility-associated-like protein
MTPQLSGTACLTVTDACSDVNQQCFNVVVEQPIPVDFAADTTSGCFPKTFNLVTNVNPALYTQSLWTLGDGTTQSNHDSISYMYPAAGVYDVTLLLTSALGCQSSLTRPNYLYSYPPPTAMWYADPQPTDISNTLITFSDASSGDIVDYQWTFSNSNNEVLGFSIETSPSFEFPGGIGGDYPTSLHIEDIHGCTDQFDATIVIKDIFAYYIPNSFTPNNDGVNDYFRFYGSDIDPKNFDLIIFNRWGQEVFHSTDPNEVWIGESINATPESLFYVNDGLYQWRAIVTSKSTGDKKELTGTVLMFR